MAVEVAFHNLQDSLSDERKVWRVVEDVKALAPDVAVFSEAYAAERQEYVGEAAERFAELGYKVTHGLYENDDDRADHHGMLAISRLAGHAALVKAGFRRGVSLMVEDPHTGVPVQIFGAHLDDRSPVRRRGQVDGVIDHFLPEGPRCVGGDFNEINPQTASAKLLRSGRFTADFLPVKYPDYDETITKLERVGNIANRVFGFAGGTVLQKFAEVGYQDANTEHKPTWHGLLELDHIVTSPEIQVGNFAVVSSELSDHSAVSATLET